ncbi:MAG: DUF177 domain-containing protein [Lentisphaerae bacterium]|nr:DUF177 domain-containing protein [Lentisphaerota bacterium]
MKIESGQVRKRPERFTGQEPSTILDLDLDPLVRAAGAVRYSLTAQRFADELLVCGVLEVEISSRCARCGESVSQTIQDGTFMRSYPLTAANESIDLTPDIREAILLALPMSFLCSAQCRGLCPDCGANLNKAPCKCGRPGKSAAWGALDQLKFK